MKLVRRINVDVRGPDQDSPTQIEHLINEALTELQTDDNGRRNKNVVEDIKELTKDSGIMSILIQYEDPTLDTQ